MQAWVQSKKYMRNVEKDAMWALKLTADEARGVFRGASGKVPVRDLFRIWDSGASQGMTDRSQVSTDASLKGERILTHTGNGPVSSTLYERVTVAPGLARVHVALPATANTVSLGSINVECKVGFQWLQP